MYIHIVFARLLRALRILRFCPSPTMIPEINKDYYYYYCHKDIYIYIYIFCYYSPEASASAAHPAILPGALHHGQGMAK